MFSHLKFFPLKIGNQIPVSFLHTFGKDMINVYSTIKTLLLSPSFTCIRIYGKVFSFSDHPRFLGYFSSFDELNAEKKAVTLSQEWLFFVCFIVNYTFLTLFLAYFVALGLRMLACMIECETQSYNR